MTILDLVILLIVAGICGALGQAITGYTRGGCLSRSRWVSLERCWECGSPGKWDCPNCFR